MEVLQELLLTQPYYRLSHNPGLFNLSSEQINPKNNRATKKIRSRPRMHKRIVTTVIVRPS